MAINLGSDCATQRGMVREVIKTQEYTVTVILDVPSQINERQSSHETCTRVAGGGHDAANDVMAAVEAVEHGLPPLPVPQGFELGPLTREDERGGGGALQ